MNRSRQSGMKNKLGLTEGDIQNILTIFIQFPEVEQAIVFGSRAKGNHRKGSDVDIALKGKQLSFNIVTRLSLILNEETSMPYKFDVLHYETISSNELKEHIGRVGFVIYNKNNAYVPAK